MGIGYLMSHVSRREERRAARMFNRAFDPDFAKRMQEVHRLWLQYLGEARMETWMTERPNDFPDTRRLVRIARVEHRLMNPSEGVHFEGDG